MVGDVLNEERSNTKDDSADATQCMKIWHLNNLLQKYATIAAMAMMENTLSSPP
jgi:hypothetical protein